MKNRAIHADIGMPLKEERELMVALTYLDKNFPLGDNKPLAALQDMKKSANA